MKNALLIVLTVLLIIINSYMIFPQTDSDSIGYGINSGAFIDFHVQRNYEQLYGAAYISLYVKSYKHEIAAGINYPYKAEGESSYEYLHPRIGVTINFNYYLLKNPRITNIYINYSFQNLRFKGDYIYITPHATYYHTEVNTFYNSTFGLGFTCSFDKNHRTGFYCVLGYLIKYSDSHKRMSWHDYQCFNLGFRFKLPPNNKNKSNS
ncbi:MAG: hypothetical protein ABIJ97_06320 [Bacteroidota bacterium]